MAYAAFPLVEISGTPFERGRLYGKAMAGRIRASIGIYGGQLKKLGLSNDEVRRVVAGFVPVMSGYAPDLVEEMRGIAAGADCAFEEIALVNGRTEIIQIGQRLAAAKSSGAVKDGCTGVVVMPEASADGTLIHAQNWDWRPECVETAIVLRVRREDGPDILTFTEAGGIARSGFNAAGLAITANYLESDLDYKQTGIPLPLIRRRYLECEHLAEGIKLVATTAKSAANNMMLSTAEGFAIDFECAPNEAFALYPSDGLLVHANHWTSVAALSKLKDTGIADVPDSYYRDYRVREALLKKVGRIGVDDVKTALFDKFGDPYGVCAPPQPRDGSIAATVAMIVMQPQQGCMEIAPMPALNRTFTRYDLKMEASVRAVA